MILDTINRLSFQILLPDYEIYIPTIHYFTESALVNLVLDQSNHVFSDVIVINEIYLENAFKYTKHIYNCNPRRRWESYYESIEDKTWS